LEDWRRKELKRQSNTRPYSPIARPRRIQARMTGRCRGPRGYVARAKNLFWQKLKRVRLDENELAQAKSHSS